MTQDLFLAAIGLVALFAGGEILLRGAIGLARRFSMPELLLGLTVVGFGTSLPELLVSLRASLEGEPEIALGNVVGSNIANVLLIVGSAALIYPAANWDRTIRRDALVMTAASVLLFALAWFSVIGRPAALMLIFLLIAYLVWSYRLAAGNRSGEEAGGEAAAGTTGDHPLVSIAQVAGGFALLFGGAQWLIDGAVGLATAIGVSQAVIGLTLVAVGTSLPELATSIAAALRGKTDIALGNIVGSNIFNILAILGITGLVIPVPVAENFRDLHIPFMLAVAVLMTMLLLGQRISRLWGMVMLACYGGYLALLVTP